MDAEDFGYALGVLEMVGFIVSAFAAWITHVVWWVGLLMNEQMDTIGEGVLAILGTLFAPIGIIHGFYIWFT